jgi:predicted transcriptional regulator
MPAAWVTYDANTCSRPTVRSNPLKEHDEIRLKWRDQIERGWQQAKRGELVDGNEVFDRLDKRLKARRTRSK